jgi:hypothetical protein
MGAVYWPGLQDGRGYTMFTLNANKSGLITQNSSGLNLVQFAWNGFQNGTTGPFQIVNLNSQMCLGVHDNPLGDGQTVDQWPWTGDADQQWNLISLGNNTYEIQNVGSGYVLTVAGNSLAAGAPIDQETWNMGSNQQWQIFGPNPQGYYNISAASTGYFLDVFHSTAPGTGVYQLPANSVDGSQLWRIAPAN